MKAIKQNGAQIALTVMIKEDLKLKKKEASGSSESMQKQLNYKSSSLQITAAFVALFGAWTIGCILCYSSPAIPSMKRVFPVNATRIDTTSKSYMTTKSSLLKNNNDNISSEFRLSFLNPDDATVQRPFLDPSDHTSETWITSIINIGALVGSLAGGPLSCRLGHRRFLFLVGLICTFGWLVMAFSSEIHILLIGRAATGLSCGFLSVSVPVYIVDISTMSSRGFIGCSFQGMLTCGIFFTSLCGAWLEWNSLAFLCAVPIAAMTVLIPLMPESPQWLLRQNRITEANKSLAALRSKDSNVSEELQLLIEQQRSSRNEMDESIQRSFFAELNQPYVWKPLMLGSFLMAFQQLSGANGLIGCMESILQRTDGALNARFGTILVNLSLVVSAWSAAVLVNMLGRKTLLLISTAGYFISYALLTVYYALDEHPQWMQSTLHLFNTNAHTLAWTPVVALLFFFLLHAIGYGGVPWFLVPELCVNPYRSQIAAVCSTVNWTISFLVMKNFTLMLKYLGVSFTFGIFAALAVASAVFIVILLPETKGKSASQIRRQFEQ